MVERLAMKIGNAALLALAFAVWTAPAHAKFSVFGAEHKAMRVFIAGDSTAAVYAPDRYPQLGWGMVLKCAFGNDVTVYDYARGGRSTRTYIEEGALDLAAKQLEPGDTLLIQFGHNDEVTTDPSRYTNPETDFRIYLKQFVDAARAKGAVPVLMTPVTRRSFDGAKVRDTHYAYGRAIIEVAHQTGTALIDLNADSMAWLTSVGEPDSTKFYLYVSPGQFLRYTEKLSDDTHFTELGARAIAELVAAKLATLDLPISKYVLKSRPALTRTVATGGEACE